MQGRGANRHAADIDTMIPPGWDYNPAEWSQRVPIVVLALVGFGISIYLALYQWDVFGSVWEPFFGNGSRTILNSSVSEALPFPDAAFGAFTYLLDAAALLVGSKRR